MDPLSVMIGFGLLAAAGSALKPVERKLIETQAANDAARRLESMGLTDLCVRTQVMADTEAKMMTSLAEFGYGPNWDSKDSIGRFADAQYVQAKLGSAVAEVYREAGAKLPELL